MTDRGFSLCASNTNVLKATGHILVFPPIGALSTKGNQLVTNDVWDAEHYDKNAIVQRDLAASMIEAMELNNRAPMTRILDVGCGDGAITATLKPYAEQVIGVDASTDMIEYAKKHILSCIFIRSDIKQFESDQQFDLITSFNCLHWVKRLDTALARIYALAKPGATFTGLIYPRCDSFWQAAENLVDTEAYHQYFTGFINPYHFYTLESFKGLLATAGFDDIQINQKEDVCNFRSDIQFTDYVKSWHPYFTVAPTSFATEWCKEYRRITGQSDSDGT